MLTKQELIAEYKARADMLGLEPKVMMDGPINSDVMVIGEGPGEREARTNIPFSGGAGHKLWDRLRKIGLSRQNVYVTNVVKRQISLSAKSDVKLKVGRHEQSLWEELLTWEVAQLPNVRYIILLGNMALHAVLGKTGITMHRGSVYLDYNMNGRPYTIICTFNPAHVIREPKWELMFDFDIGRVGKVYNGKWSEYKIEHIINPSFADAMSWIKKMQSDQLPVSLDIESMGTETACIGLTNEDHTGMCINFRDEKDHRYTLEEEVTIRKAIQNLSDDPTTKYVAQNGVFDSYWTWYKDCIDYRRIWFDTLLAHHTLYPKLPHSLAFLVSQYTTHPYYKDEGHTWKETGGVDNFWRYNVKDACLTRAIHKRLMVELQQQKMDKFFFEHVMHLQPHLVPATVHGVKLDLTLRQKLNEELTIEVAKLKQEFLVAARVATNDSELVINPNSSPQMSNLFFNKLRLIGRGTSTDELNRKKMREHPRTSEAARLMLTALDKYKEESKFLSTYVETQIDPDGRIRCEYKQYGTANAPGRLSSSAVLWGSGGNLQNQPKRAYEMFIADEGCAFGYIDGEQAEARVVAFLANIPKWKSDFERARLGEDLDCHRSLASDMWGIPYGDVPKEDEIDGKKTKRFIAKRCRHGLNYRMMAPRLSDTTGLPMSSAIEAFNIYHKITPELQIWWKETIREIKENKVIYSPMGRRFVLMERPTDEALDSIIAFRPQSTIGDKVCQVWYESEEDRDWPRDCRIAMNIHDALIAHGPISQIPEALHIMKKHAEKPIIIRGEECIIPAAAKMSKPDATGVHRWSTLEKFKFAA